MEIYISIDGILRNKIQKLEYHYINEFLSPDSTFELDDDFDYSISEEIKNDDLLGSFKFSSKEHFEYFYYIEYVLEIFGHAGLGEENAISKLNKIIAHNKPLHNITIVGLDELGKAKPATLFFLSKNGFMGDNIKFIRSDDISNEWNKCDVWITDNKKILESCPENSDKIAIKYNTCYNQHFTFKNEIDKLIKINLPCFTMPLEENITLTLTESQKNVESHPEQPTTQNQKEKEEN